MVFWCRKQSNGWENYIDEQFMGGWIPRTYKQSEFTE